VKLGKSCLSIDEMKVKRSYKVSNYVLHSRDRIKKEKSKFSKGNKGSNL